jgi:hypothetical protein
MSSPARAARPGAPAPFQAIAMKTGRAALNEIAALHAVRNLYGGDAEKEKRRLIARARADPPGAARALARLHEDLLFIRAFPGEPATLRLARGALGRVEAMRARLPARARARLDDSGIAGSKTRHVLAYEIVRWLLKRTPAAAEFDWRGFDAAGLDPLLREMMRPSEREGYDLSGGRPRDWIRSSRRRGAKSDLQWVVAALGPPLRQALIDELWTQAEPAVVWDLSGSRFSVTHNVLPRAAVVMRRSLRRPPADPAQRIAAPLGAIALLPEKRARAVIETTRAAVAARCREVTAITYANPREVHWCDLGEGVGLAVIGAPCGRRMAIEANYAYLILSNGAPIGYGGVTALFRQANTGINIFDAYRRSEAAFLWTETLRAFATLFGARRFVVNGYQFGEGNSEAIASGAYWFYYRLGFRPAAPELRRLAAREAARIGKPGAAPSDRATLKALARGDLFLDLPGFDAADYFEESLLARIGACAARILSAEPVASRAAAERRIAARLADALGAGSTGRWSADERRAFQSLAPVAAIIPDLSAWPAADKALLLAMMRAKGAAQESDFARAAGACPRFFHALAAGLKEG